jgi:hypothetical protein
MQANLRPIEAIHDDLGPLPLMRHRHGGPGADRHVA